MRNSSTIIAAIDSLLTEVEIAQIAAIVKLFTTAAIAAMDKQM